MDLWGTQHLNSVILRCKAIAEGKQILFSQTFLAQLFSKKKSCHSPGVVGGGVRKL